MDKSWWMKVYRMENRFRAFSTMDNEKVALELVACVADVLSLADEDGEVHGDLKPGLSLDSRGLVHVVGYGEGRRGGRTPEGRSGALSSDVYGLGLI